MENMMLALSLLLAGFIIVFVVLILLIIIITVYIDLHIFSGRLSVSSLMQICDGVWADI